MVSAPKTRETKAGGRRHHYQVLLLVKDTAQSLPTLTLGKGQFKIAATPSQQEAGDFRGKAGLHQRLVPREVKKSLDIRP